MTFAEFAAANRKRCEAPDGFGRKVGPESSMPMTLGLGEEAGEVLGKVRALLEFSKRKKATVQDVLDEIADVVSYADLLAQCMGSTLEAALIAKWNRVSERCGSPERIGVPQGEQEGAP